MFISWIISCFSCCNTSHFMKISVNLVFLFKSLFILHVVCERQHGGKYYAFVYSLILICYNNSVALNCVICLMGMTWVTDQESGINGRKQTV